MIKNIINDARELLTTTIKTDTREMTDYERKAYNMGVSNAFSAIETIATDTNRCMGCKFECNDASDQAECMHCSRAYSDEFEPVM